jgi:hypothetical protein
MRGVHALINDVAAAVVVVGIVVGVVGIVGVAVIVAVGIKSIAVVTEVVIVTSTNDRAGAKTAEAATIVDDGGARAKTMEAAVKFAAVEATTAKAATAVEATAAKAATAEATAAMAAATTTSTTACQPHGRRSQANSCSSQHDHCLSQHLVLHSRFSAQHKPADGDCLGALR